MIKVSIIVPIYNVSKYVIRCIDSIINQTYTNIECILVDDCSPDNSMILLEQRLKLYQGNIDFKIIHHKQNKGLSEARNTGTYESTGDYLFYLDSDDEIQPNCIKTLTTLAEKYPEVEIVQGNTQSLPCPTQKSDWRNLHYKKFQEYVNDNKWILKHFYNVKEEHIPVNAWNKLIKRNFIFDYNLFFKKGIIHEDEFWMFLLVKKLNSIAFTSEYTYVHYTTHGSIMQSGSNYKSIECWLIILKEILINPNDSFFEYFKEKYVRILYFKMCLINLNTNELQLYYLYKILVKDIIKNLLKKKKIAFTLPLFILLIPQSFYKSFAGAKIFNLFIKLNRK